MRSTDHLVAQIIAVFQDAAGHVLLCERAAGGWELPQCGVDAGEARYAALRRGMRDEIGTDRFDIIGIGAAETRCDWRREMHKWFLVRFRAGVVPSVAECRWVQPEDAIMAVHPRRRGVYAAGLAALGLTLTIPGACSRGEKPMDS